MDTHVALVQAGAALWQGFGTCIRPMNIGAELREARRQAGLSREDLSQRTKIQLAKIDALEANAFERLPEGIYLDGLIRAYANEVGLDGSAMVARLHRHNTIPVEDDIDEIDEINEIHRDTDIGELSLATGGLREVDRADYMVPPPVSAGVTPAFSATTVPERRRRGGFLLPLLTLVAAMALGAYLYDRSRSFGFYEAAAPAVSHEDTVAADAATASTPTATGTPDVIPADRPASTEHHTDERVAQPHAATIPGASTSVPESSSSETLPAGTPKVVASDIAPAPSRTGATTDVPELTEDRRADDVSATADISGSWTLNTRVESSTVRDYEGLELGYELQLQQSGSRVAGEGMKTLENGRQIARFAQTPIIVSGTFEEGRLTLTFTERGHQRDSGGKMILDVSEDGVLRGRFSSSAARSSGTAEARRP